MGKILIKINGKDVELKNSSNIAEMLVEREVSGTMFVVEKNKEIVPKQNYNQTPVLDNDCFEIVSFFGGG